MPTPFSFKTKILVSFGTSIPASPAILYGLCPTIAEFNAPSFSFINIVSLNLFVSSSDKK